ncbi:MAG: DUF1858 domain-containing protein [Actinobacteria bacterium]|nr:DUF1858 domain-containing protein [Actinomycetota bacterium]MCL5882753.1 DUF1858 domain-containing protein [Actinomycetota bacterium]
MSETSETSEITEIDGETIIGDVVERLPGGAEVIEKYFGNGCFTCPGIRMESINFGATMHGVNAEDVVADLRALLEKQ